MRRILVREGRWLVGCLVIAAILSYLMEWASFRASPEPEFNTWGIALFSVFVAGGFYVLTGIIRLAILGVSRTSRN